MASVVRLHIGAPKTGTTYLQDRLYRNRESLAEQGVTYPVGSGQTDLFLPALDLLNEGWGGQRDNARGEWKHLINRVARASGTVVLSHEILAGASRLQARRAFGDLAAEAELHLVFSVRDVARQIPAEWQETVKHRRQWSFEKFVVTVMEDDRRDPKEWFWRAQSLTDVMNRWALDLPPERVHLVTVPQLGSPPDELWLRYCRALGLDPAWLPVDSDRSNASIGATDTLLLRKLNRRLAEAGLSSAAYRSIVREFLVHQTLAQRQTQDRVTLPPQAMDWAEQIAQEWIDWASASGVDVVGDLEELRPVREEQPWVDPDRPRRGAVNEASLDLIVALILNLAEREAADSSVIGRAARRLRGQ